MDNNFQILPFEPKYLELLKEGIRKGWGTNHVLQQSDELLLWQYHGFGEKAGVNVPLLFHEKRLIGYRLLIPIEISLSNSQGLHKIITSAVSTLFYVDDNFRGMKLGLKLQLYTIEHYGGYFAIASNLKTSAPIYKKSGAKMMDSMYRYFRPLAQDISSLLVNNTGKKWERHDGNHIVEPHNIEARELAYAWHIFTSGKNITSLNRSEEFFQWRYLNSPIYQYQIFGNSKEGGYIVGRICDLYDEKHKKTGKKVYRILELIPTNQEVWEYQTDKNLSLLIEGVCGWAQAQGCIAAEFYTSSSRFGKLLAHTSFEEINKEEPLASSVMSYFEPMTIKHRLSNVSIQSALLDDTFNFEDSYFTLSDADQDRPNVI